MEFEQQSQTIYRESYEQFIRRFSKYRNISVFDASRLVRGCVMSVSEKMKIPSSQVFSMLFPRELNMDIIDRCEQIIIDMFA